MAIAIAKVKGIAPVLIHEILKRPDMGIGQIHDMDVIPDTGAVPGRVIGPEDPDLLPETHGRLNDQWDEMGLGLMKLANVPLRVSAGGIEVPQIDVLETVGPIIVLQDLLDEELGPAIGIDRILRMVFGDGDLLRMAVGGAGGGEDEMFHTEFSHHLEEVQCADHIIPVICFGLEDGLLHKGKGAEVHDRLDPAVFKTGPELIDVQEVALKELTPFDKSPVATAQIVKDDRLETFLS